MDFTSFFWEAGRDGVWGDDLGWDGAQSLDRSASQTLAASRDAQSIPSFSVQYIQFIVDKPCLLLFLYTM